ncbi:MAG: alpha/beta hydrolase, partial [Chromatiales bacterium]
MLIPPLQDMAKLLLFGAVIYLGLLLFLYLYQDHLLYLPDLPSRKVDITPENAGLAFESVTLTAEDGVKTDGWFLPHPKARATLLFFHGNAGNISHRLDSLALFHSL